jgi:photosystem II stability/assembly factor-like uncharacterized protein
MPSWTKAGPAFATAIAFAPGAPSVAYACGINGQTDAQELGPIGFGVSQDGGHTWATGSTPGHSLVCRLSVNPLDARDLVLLTATCTQGCTSNPQNALFRSRDGGLSWTRLSPPTGGTPAPEFGGQVAWAGTALFANTVAYPPNSQGPAQHLATSINGGPFAWVDNNTIFAKSSLGVPFALGTAIYVPIFPPTCQGQQGYFCALAKTTNYGMTWSRIDLRYQGATVDLLAVGTDGKSLLVGTPSGAIMHTSLAITADDGATWHAVPAIDGGFSFFSAPDGTLFSITQDPTGPLYRLDPGATQWRQVVPALPPVNHADGFPVFSWNAAGHTVAEWMDAGADPNNNNAELPGLQFYRLGS